MLVNNLNPTGTTVAEQIKVVVAVHTGYTTAMLYKHKKSDTDPWPNYKAWLAMKSHPKFLLPTPNHDNDACYDITCNKNLSINGNGGDKELTVVYAGSSIDGSSATVCETQFGLK